MWLSYRPPITESYTCFLSSFSRLWSAGSTARFDPSNPLHWRLARFWFLVAGSGPSSQFSHRVSHYWVWVAFEARPASVILTSQPAYSQSPCCRWCPSGDGQGGQEDLVMRLRMKDCRRENLVQRPTDEMKSESATLANGREWHLVPCEEEKTLHWDSPEVQETVL